VALKQYFLGSVGPFVFDDGGTFPDGSPHGLRCSKTPVNSSEVMRKGDVGGGGIAAPENAEYVVVSLDAGLTQERRLQVGTGLTLTDGGANGDLTIGVDEANIDHDSLSNFVANEHIDWTGASQHLKTSDDVEIGSAAAFYLGDPTTDGSWRMIRSGNDLLMERRESAAWVTKQTIVA